MAGPRGDLAGHHGHQPDHHRPLRQCQHPGTHQLGNHRRLASESKDPAGRILVLLVRNSDKKGIPKDRDRSPVVQILFHQRLDIRGVFRVGACG